MIPPSYPPPPPPPPPFALRESFFHSPPLYSAALLATTDPTPFSLKTTWAPPSKKKKTSMVIDKSIVPNKVSSTSWNNLHLLGIDTVFLFFSRTFCSLFQSSIAYIKTKKRTACWYKLVKILIALIIVASFKERELCLSSNVAVWSWRQTYKWTFKCSETN